MGGVQPCGVLPSSHRITNDILSAPMAASIPEASSTGPATQIYAQVDAYPWDVDAEFQAGLRAILGPNANTGQAEHLTLRARCFYFSRQDYLTFARRE